MTHLKTLASPRSMKVHKKETKFIITPAPGPHGTLECVPLGILLRDYLSLAENRREIKYLLNERQVLVDGRRIKDDNLPLGLFDVISIPEIEKNYILLVDKHSRLFPQEIDKKKAEHKLCKLVGKTMVAGAKLQLNFYDGKNIVVDAKDSKKYTVGGTVVLKLPEMKIIEYMPLEVGKIAMVAKGRHAGKKGKILEMTKSDLNLKSLATLDCGDEKLLTNTDYLYMINDKL